MLLFSFIAANDKLNGSVKTKQKNRNVKKIAIDMVKNLEYSSYSNIKIVLTLEFLQYDYLP